jgi:hypothetical protein
VAEFAVTQGIQDEPAFIWWVPYVLAKRKWIVAAVSKWYHKWMPKYGIEIPSKNYDDCMWIDHENGETPFGRMPTICLEMVKVFGSHSKFSMMINPFQQHTNRYIVIWITMWRWRISTTRHDS